MRLACVLLALLSACVQLPLCDTPTVQIAQGVDGDRVFILDMDNAKKLIATLRGVEAGTCRLPKDGTKNGV